MLQKKSTLILVFQPRNPGKRVFHILTFLWWRFSVAECICPGWWNFHWWWNMSWVWFRWRSANRLQNMSGVILVGCQTSTMGKVFTGKINRGEMGKVFSPHQNPWRFFANKSPTVLRCHWSKSILQALKLLPLFIRSTIGSISPQQYAHLLHSSPQN